MPRLVQLYFVFWQYTVCCIYIREDTWWFFMCHFQLTTSSICSFSRITYKRRLTISGFFYILLSIQNGSSDRKREGKYREMNILVIHSSNGKTASRRTFMHAAEKPTGCIGKMCSLHGQREANLRCFNVGLCADGNHYGVCL